MECGLCGSGICADEKFKQLKDGGVKRHVYYGCTKVRDKTCKCGYLKEDELIDQLALLMDTISLDEIGIREKIKLEVKRFKKFQRYVLGTKEFIEIGDIDVRNYAKYILKEGANLEKRDLLCCLKSKIVLSSKVIMLLPDSSIPSAGRV